MDAMGRFADNPNLQACGCDAISSIVSALPDNGDYLGDVVFAVGAQVAAARALQWYVNDHPSPHPALPPSDLCVCLHTQGIREIAFLGRYPLVEIVFNSPRTLLCQIDVEDELSRLCSLNRSVGIVATRDTKR